MPRTERVVVIQLSSKCGASSVIQVAQGEKLWDEIVKFANREREYSPPETVDLTDMFDFSEENQTDAEVFSYLVTNSHGSKYMLVFLYSGVHMLLTCRLIDSYLIKGVRYQTESTVAEDEELERKCKEILRECSKAESSSMFYKFIMKLFFRLTELEVEVED